MTFLTISTICFSVRYIYMMNNHASYATAAVISSKLNATAEEEYCIEFYAYMDTNNTAQTELSLELHNSNGSFQNLLHIRGKYLYWKLFQINISSFKGRLRFKAWVGNASSDIAIDEFFIKAGSCENPSE